MKNQKIKRLEIIKKVANLEASLLVRTPAAIGRFLVRDINLSVSDSMTILNAFAAPAANVPPSSDAIVGINGGQPSAAKKSAGMVVMMSNSTTRSFISSMYGRTSQDY